MSRQIEELGPLADYSPSSRLSFTDPATGGLPLALGCQNRRPHYGSKRPFYGSSRNDWRLGWPFGMKQAMKGGVGSFTVALDGGVLVASLAVVNALGDVRDPATGKIVAGARKAADSREFANTPEVMKRGSAIHFIRSNIKWVRLTRGLRLRRWPKRWRRRFYGR